MKLEMREYMRIFKFIFIIFIIIIVSGCSRKALLVDFKSGTTLDATFDEISRSVTVIMPNGEVLTGKFSPVSNATFSFGNAFSNATAYSGMHAVTAFGSTSAYGFSSGGISNAYALLRSHTSKLMMEVIVKYSEFNGHGYGEARTNNGRKFKVQF